MTRGLACVPAALLLLSACTVGPKYQRPQTPVAPGFSEAPQSFTESAGWKQAQPADQTLRADWWRLFNNDELNGLEDQVNASNQSLQAADAQYRQARALIQINRAGLFPTISTAPSVNTSRSSSTATTRAGDYAQYSLPLDINYELDAWGRIHRSIAAAREEAQATAADLETIRLSLHAELASDYFELRSLDAQKALLDDTMQSYQRALDLTQTRYDGGLSSRAEVAQARTQFETARSQQIGLGVQRAAFEHAIAVLMGHTPESLKLKEDPLHALPPVVPVGIPSQLLERRPDIAAAERRAAAANEQIGIARAAFFPNLVITATGGFEGSTLVNWFTWPSRFWAVGPAMLQTIFDAGRRRAQSESAVAGYDQSVANYRQATLTAFQEVEDNLAALRVLEDQAKAQRTAVEAAQQSLDLSMTQYKGGLVTYLQVVVAQTTVLQNQLTEADILRRRMDASVLLIKALGGGWDVSKLPT